MSKLYDLAVKTGTYESGGETRNRYQNVGAIIEGTHGPYLLLERTFNPAGVPGQDDRSSVIISLFKPKAKDEQPRHQPFKDDIPGDNTGEIPF